MNIVKRIILVILVALGVAAGAAKIMLMPDEIELFQVAGFGENLLFIFGLIQITSAILMLFVKPRRIGAAALAATFAISTVLIFLSGQVAFGIGSLIPILLIGIIIRDTSRIFSLKKKTVSKSN
jgi:hypothetical protein